MQIKAVCTEGNFPANISILPYSLYLFARLDCACVPPRPVYLYDTPIIQMWGGIVSKQV